MSMGGDVLRAIGGAFSRKTATLFKNLSPMPALRFRHGTPRSLMAKPPFSLPGDPERGEEILDGRFTFAGESLDIGPDGEPWTRPAPSRRFAQGLHSFGWLADLAALENAAGAQKAKVLIDGWIEIYGRGNAFAWSTPVLCARVINWFAQADLILDGDESKADERRCTTLLRQGYALNSFTVLGARSAIIRLQAGAALALCGLCLPKVIHWLDKGLDQLEEESACQTLDDGGHASRNPEGV